MRILPVVYLYDLLIIFTSQVSGQSQTFDVTIGKLCFFLFSRFHKISVLNSGGVFTDRDEGTESQSMESIFKYAIFHYNRLIKDAHNLSFKIRLKEETLSLIASESAVQTVHDGKRVFLLRLMSEKKKMGELFSSFQFVLWSINVVFKECLDHLILN